MSESVSAQYLLNGAVYALEQCGLLLRDANLLYRSGSCASALALAAFAREELGRWKILLDLRKRVVGGECLAVEEIQSQCDSHVDKQEAGMTSITMRGDRDSGLGKLLQGSMNAAPGSKESKEAREQIEKLDRQKKRRTPEDRHKQRMTALYVDAVSVSRWNRPGKDIPATAARDFINDAANDYSLQYSQGYTHLEFIKEADPELYAALALWGDRPELPRPEWPPFDVPGSLSKLVDELSDLTVVEAAELATALEEKWGVQHETPYSGGRETSHFPC